MYCIGLLWAAFATISTASAQDTIDIGALKNRDIKVVQKILYSKKGKFEYGGHLAMMPFDAYTFTGKIDATVGQHLNEALAWEVALGGGYGFKNSTYEILEGPSYAITPDAYRYLGSIVADVQYAPIYAKMNVANRWILHHDMYVLGGAGLTIEQAFMEDKSMAYAPTIALGGGLRIFLPNKSAIRLQIRDDILLQTRIKTEKSNAYYIKQNASLSVGYVFFQ